MKKIILSLFVIILLLLSACQKQLEPIVIEETDYVFTETVGDKIEVIDIDIPYSTTEGQIDNFINIHKPKEINPLYFISSDIKTHQIIFVFEHIYPIDYIAIYNPDSKDALAVEDVDIDVSLNLLSYDRLFQDYVLEKSDNQIELGGTMAKSVKITFNQKDEKQKLTDVSFYLNDGMIVKEDLEMSDAFLRYQGWTGADGIFTFDMNNGGDRIGVDHETTGFIFSDTFVGEVYENNKLRKSSLIINNSFGYLSHNDPFDRDQLSFDYDIKDGVAKSVIEPNEMIGSRARNLLDNDGIMPSYDQNGLLTNVNEGTMWLSDQIDNELIIDLKKEVDVSSIYLWNFNETITFGVQSFNLYVAKDQTSFTLIDTYEIEQASGLDQSAYQLRIDLDQEDIRYIKIEILSSYDQTYVGLGKLLIQDENQNPLFGNITAAHEITELTDNEKTSRYWLQDGVMIDHQLYVFPILVKDDADIFKVHHVSMVEVPIVDQRFDYKNQNYYSTPLMTHTPDGGVIYYGAGLMDHRDKDGYIYIYGYKDLDGRRLTVGRFLPEDIKDFNNWMYFDGQDWSKNINESVALIDKVSAELSVTYMTEGLFKDKYMLTVMEDTTSGKISYSLADSPVGPFSDYTLIYQTTEGSYLRDAFSYNAKLHPNLSEPGNFVISYNVNTRSAGALSDARIYYPRFIRMVEVKKR
ncbi:hypothetical protein BK011_02575 [Tenericutes bacterium MZ-XQ]|nr:hypothetical protein BK011_02575 [Tenericutes bacterium MZ-XQ]